MATLSRSQISKTVLRSLVVGTCLSIAVSYLLYASSPGLVIMDICEFLSIPSSVAVQYFGVKLHSELFETVVNSLFYALVVAGISLVYQRIRAGRSCQPTEGARGPD